MKIKTKKTKLIGAMLLSTVAVTGTLTSTSAMAGAKQLDVKTYLNYYRVNIDKIKNYPKSFSKSEKASMKKTDGLTSKSARSDLALTSLLINAIVAGKLDDCCWSDTGRGYNEFFRARGETLYNQRTTISNGKQSRKTTAQFVRAYDNLDRTLKQVKKGRYYRYTLNTRNNLAYNTVFMMRMAAKFNRDLEWNFMYVEKNGLNDAFRNNYAYACLSCKGAGFYDWKKLFNKIPGQGSTTYLDRLIKDPQYVGLNALKDNSKGPSIGFAMQVSNKYRTGRPGADDNNSVYPPHCHKAKELYMSLNSGLVTGYGAGWSIADLKNDGHFSRTAAGGQRGLYWQKDMRPYVRVYPQYINGDTAYLKPWIYHSMQPGRRYQFMAWARLDDPDGGTVFPFIDKQPACVK